MSSSDSASVTNRLISPKSTRKPGMGENSSSGTYLRPRSRSKSPMSPLCPASREVCVVVGVHEGSLVDTNAVHSEVVEGLANPLEAVVRDGEVAARAMVGAMTGRQVFADVCGLDPSSRAVREPPGCGADED